MIGLAGLCSSWHGPAKEDEDPDRWILTATILTSDALHTLEGIHDCLPEEL